MKIYIVTEWNGHMGHDALLTWHECYATEARAKEECQNAINELRDEFKEPRTKLVWLQQWLGSWHAAIDDDGVHYYTITEADLK